MIFFFIILIIGKYQSQKYIDVKIGNITINSEIADTLPKQIRGLMFRENLPKNNGMLFIFSKEEKHSIWMANTSIPLDIIWIDKNKKIIFIEKNAKPCESLGYCPIYKTDMNSKYILEVNSGFSDKNKIKVGQYINFKL